MFQRWAINIILLISVVAWAAITYVFTINALIVLTVGYLEADWFGLVGSLGALLAVFQIQKRLLALRKTKKEK